MVTGKKSAESGKKRVTKKSETVNVTQKRVTGTKKTIKSVGMTRLSLAKPDAPVLVKKPAGPTARVCPLVLDGEVSAADFSPNDCLTCGEFDCRFCAKEESSGLLGSRLFAAQDDASEESDEDWSSPDFSIEEEGPESDTSEED